MKNPKVDIYKSLMINRIVVYALIFAFVGVCITFSLSLGSLYDKMLSTVLVIDPKGEVIPMTWMERDENIKIEIMNHLDMFHKDFYEYDSYNYEKKIEKALWLADESAEQIYINRSNDGWFNKVRMYGIKQTCEIKPEDIEIQGTKEPYLFRVKSTITIKQGKEEIKYSLETTGTIVNVNRNYPLNPHGFLITSLVEGNLNKLSNGSE